ncbi:24984_t:CDS:2 [Gigaspora rosea]|nr:24984_t:CDS:2 [Gigaspora rosea]
MDYYKERIRSPAEHYEIKPTMPDSLDTEKWNNYREELSNFLEYMNLTPIYSELALIDNILNEFPSESDQKIIDEYKKKLVILAHFIKKKGTRSRNIKFAKNLLVARRKLGNGEVRKNFFNRAKFPMSILTDKDITPIIDEFKDLFKDFLKI